MLLDLSYWMERVIGAGITLHYSILKCVLNARHPLEHLAPLSLWKTDRSVPSGWCLLAPDPLPDFKSHLSTRWKNNNSLLNKFNISSLPPISLLSPSHTFYALKVNCHQNDNSVIIYSNLMIFQTCWTFSLLQKLNFWYTGHSFLYKQPKNLNYVINCVPLCEIQAKVSKSNYEIKSIKMIDFYH